MVSQLPLAQDAVAEDLEASAEELIRRGSRESAHLSRMLDLLATGGQSARAMVRHGLARDEIIAEAREGRYDLLVIGASNEWQIKSLLVGALPDAAADRAPCSVLMVRRYESTGISTTRRILSSLRGWT